MNTRLEQQVADSLQGYEQQQAWRDRAKRDWASARSSPMGDIWRPTFTERQQQEHEQFVIDQQLPF